ncbi:MAG: ATP-dependent 6-phosphofructokinase [bacterium]
MNTESAPDLSIHQLQPVEFPSPLHHYGNVTYVSDAERLLFHPHIPLERDNSLSFEIAGPRKQLHFDPSKTRAGMVTCGGLCPGLNAVIRGLVMELWYAYGCRDIKGIRYGYQGLREDAAPPIDLTPSLVSGIRSDGGTWLGSSRGAPSTSTIVDTLVKWGITLLFTIGGDGTMRGAHFINEEIRRRGLDIAVVGIPKTIDNDIPFVRRSFGFETAVGEAATAINAAEVEAKGVPYGIGLVKIMGRQAGFIAATATIASGNANFCLIPEIPFSLEGEGGLFDLITKQLEKSHHVVVIVAEGAGQEFFDPDELGVDASGNQKLGDIGVLLKKKLASYFSSQPMPVSIKYIDPSYLIRAKGPNFTDQLYADRLSRNAVHAGMAGKTGMLIGQWHGQLTHVPMHALHNRHSRVRQDGELWFNVRENTGQPHVIGSPQCKLTE